MERGFIGDLGNVIGSGISFIPSRLTYGMWQSPWVIAILFIIAIGGGIYVKNLFS